MRADLPKKTQCGKRVSQERRTDNASEEKGAIGSDTTNGGVGKTN